MTLATLPLLAVCCKCGHSAEVRPLTDGSPAAPPGWKRLNHAQWCPDCWHAAYVLRAISVPVVGPIGHTWDELGAALRTSWQQATEAANWIVTELAKAEPAKKGDGKLDKFRHPADLYLRGRAQFPTLDSQSFGSILQGVKKRYGKRRFDVQARHAASLPTYRYPHPIPVPAKDAKVERRDHRYLLSLRLAGTRFTVSLRSKRRGRHSFARQLAALDRVMAGESLMGEVQIGRQSAGPQDHRGGVAERDETGRKSKYRVMARVAVWLPRQAAKERSGTLTLRTDGSAFWIAQAGDRSPWVLNADHVRRWVVRHRRQLDRLSDDTKFEKRWPKEERAQINGFRDRLCDRQNARLAEWCRQASAMLAGYADRQNIAEVVYDDTVRPYDFPWSSLRTRLGQLLDEKGIKLTLVSGSAPSGD